MVISRGRGAAAAAPPGGQGGGLADRDPRPLPHTDYMTEWFSPVYSSPKNSPYISSCNGARDVPGSAIGDSSSQRSLRALGEIRELEWGTRILAPSERVRYTLGLQVTKTNPNLDFP